MNATPRRPSRQASSNLTTTTTNNNNNNTSGTGFSANDQHLNGYRNTSSTAFVNASNFRSSNLINTGGGGVRGDQTTRTVAATNCFSNTNNHTLDVRNKSKPASSLLTQSSGTGTFTIRPQNAAAAAVASDTSAALKDAFDLNYSPILRLMANRQSSQKSPSVPPLAARRSSLVTRSPMDNFSDAKEEKEVEENVLTEDGNKVEQLINGSRQLNPYSTSLASTQRQTSSTITSAIAGIIGNNVDNSNRSSDQPIIQSPLRTSATGTNDTSAFLERPVEASERNRFSGSQSGLSFVQSCSDSKRASTATRREPKLAPEIIFLIREHAKTLESISLITRKLHEIELKVNQIATKMDNDPQRSADVNQMVNATTISGNGTGVCGAANLGNRNTLRASQTLDQADFHCTKRTSTSSTSGHLHLNHHLPPNVLSDDSGGEYGRATTNTNSGDEDELLSLLDKITKCSHHIQQTQAVAAVQSGAMLNSIGRGGNSIDARLPSCSTGGASTATFLGSQYASPIGCGSVSNSQQQPLPMTAQLFNSAIHPLLTAQSAQQMSSDLYQTARQTPQLTYANPSLAMQQFHHVSAYSAPPFQAAPPLPPHLHHLLHHQHPHHQQQPLTQIYAPAYLAPAPMAAYPSHPVAYAQSQQPPPFMPQQRVAQQPQQQPPPPPPPAAAMNTILFDPNVERFLNNLDHLVNSGDDRTSSAMVGSGLSAILQPPTTISNAFQSRYMGLAVNSSTTEITPSTLVKAPSISNWQLEKMAELISKKERQSIDARYKMADDWLANCLSREATSANVVHATGVNSVQRTGNSVGSNTLNIASTNVSANNHSTHGSGTRSTTTTNNNNNNSNNNNNNIVPANFTPYRM